MNYFIRECTISDSEAIYLLNKEEMGYDYPKELTLGKLAQVLRSTADKVYVAEYGGAVIGYVHANSYDLLYNEPMKNIMGIAVSSAFQQKGIGRALLSKVEEWAKMDHASGVRLVSGATRKNAHSFYRKCGYGGEKEQLNFKKIF